MKAVLIAELLDKTGHVTQRFHLREFPVDIGRGYHNDIILDDEFVSASHARIELTENGEPVLVDLASENGTYTLPELERVDRLPLASDTLLRLGHTLLRLRRPDHVVPPTRRDSLGESPTTHWLTQGSGAALSLACAILLTGLLHYQQSAEVQRLEQLAFSVLPVALALPVWAGLWALVSRSFAHHAFFVPHLAIASLGVVTFLLANTAAEYYAFATSAGWSGDLVFQAVALLLGALVLYGHLRFATLLTPRGAGTASLLTAAVLSAVLSLGDYVSGLEFSDDLPYPGELKPPAFRPARAVTPAEFAEQAQQVVNKLNTGELD